MALNQRQTCRSRFRSLLPTLSAILLMFGVAHAEEPQHNLLLFASVDTFDTFDESTVISDDTWARITGDILYSYSGGDFRFLAEYLWSSSEAELERMKAGWQVRDDTMVWFGRFHATAKHWTSEYHHGQFLQTSITRPSLEEWEDESGPIPSHITGLSIEYGGGHKGGRSADVAFSVGLAPKFGGTELIPYDILDPRSGHGGSASFRMAYRPDILSPMQVGLLVGYNEINVLSDSHPNLSDLNRVDQLTVAAYADWRWRDWRTITNVVHFTNDMSYLGGKVSDSFVLAYVQLEYEANKDWTIFGRTDNGFGEDDSPYLSLLPHFIAHRHMVGARWDIAEFHSLTAEIADTSAQGTVPMHEHFKEVRFQWSAVFQ